MKLNICEYPNQKKRLKKISILSWATCFLLLVAIIFNSCKEESDPGILPNIVFKTGTGYISASQNIAKGSNVKIGINANKTEDVDVLKSFNISRSINGAADVSVYQKSLSVAEGDNFSYDYTATLDTVAGETEKFTFTITNRDGLTNQVNLTLTLQ